MRIKDVGATINLGDYSSLHITIGEEYEFAGLDLGRAETYLRNIAKSVNGVLNLPEKAEPKDNSPQEDKTLQYPKKDLANKLIYYDDATHKYAGQNGTEYHSVTTMLKAFYPLSPYIKKAYLDYASAFGNLVHTAIQNAVIGQAPKKSLTLDVVSDTLTALGEYHRAEVEQIIQYPAQEIAGRFDILLYPSEDDTHCVLYDVKTNSDLYASRACSLPDSLKSAYGQFWNPETVYGEHCLQLNIYAYILEHEYGKIVDKIYIIHIPDSFEKVVPVPKKDVSQIFQAYSALR